MEYRKILSVPHCCIQSQSLNGRAHTFCILICSSSYVLHEKLIVAQLGMIFFFFSKQLWHPKVQYLSSHKPPLDPVMRQMNPTHSLTPIFL